MCRGKSNTASLLVEKPGDQSLSADRYKVYDTAGIIQYTGRTPEIDLNEPKQHL